MFHVLGWLLFFSLIIGFTYHSPDGENVIREIFTPPYVVFYATYVCIFYANANFLMPRLYFNKKHLLYFTHKSVTQRKLNSIDVAGYIAHLDVLNIQH